MANKNLGSAARDTVRVGAMTLKISREQKQACMFYDLLFGLCERVLPGCGCDVVLLPERCAFRPADIQPLDGANFQRFAGLARQHRLFLIAPLVESAGGVSYNTLATLSPAGKLVHVYRKVHLAPGEEKDTRPGPLAGEDSFAAFDLPWFKAGVLTCFDNHFPEPSRCLALAGAEVLFWPAFGNVARPAVDPARCIDNGVYFVGSGVIDMACNLPAEVFNRGAIFNPAGETVAQTGADDGLAVADLPLDATTGRLRLPPPPFEPCYLRRRVPGSYGRLT